MTSAHQKIESDLELDVEKESEFENEKMCNQSLSILVLLSVIIHTNPITGTDATVTTSIRKYRMAKNNET